MLRNDERNSVFARLCGSCSCSQTGLQPQDSARQHIKSSLNREVYPLIVYSSAVSMVPTGPLRQAR